MTITEYDYPLPEERIAKYPLEKRDASKLLVLKNNEIHASHFKDIGQFLPKHSLIVFNETKVIRARLQFIKDSGASIEIFCLDPITGNGDYQSAFNSTSSVEWRCLVGNSRRWKDRQLFMNLKVHDIETRLMAVQKEKKEAYSIIKFSWEPKNFCFAEVLEAGGEVPLPPYLHREVEPSDRERYQTVFAKNNGSVAAPTAGLHFTKPLMQKLLAQGHSFEEITLHVSAGTFRPMSSNIIGEHIMHSETIIVKHSCIQNLINNCNKTVITVGTTSMRTLESLYWLGLMLQEQGLEKRKLHIEQWFPYQDRNFLPTAQDSLKTILYYLDKHEMTELHATTDLMIAPTCPIKLTKALITNFHQPKSTLLLLVSAFIGEQWKKVYKFALDNDFRFLSYGDSCLFIP